MPIVYGQVGAPSTTSAADGANQPALQGKQGELLFSEVHGKYFTQNYRNNLYFASTAAAGVTVSIFSNASFTGLGIWNPQGSGKNLSMVRALIGCNAAAATAESGFGYAWLNNAGSGVGTAAPISAFSTTGVIRGTGQCSPNTVGASVVQNAVISATLTTAMTWGRFSGFSSSTGAITTQIALGMFIEDFDGMMIVPPGTFWAMTSSIASGGTFGLSAIWEELPL